MADLDGLKQLNDRFGHESGDAAITAAGRVLADTFRATDVVARLGGDDVAVLAVDTGAQPCAAVADRLARNVDAYVARAAHLYRVGMSLGWAPYDDASGRSLRDLMQSADDALNHYELARHAPSPAA